MAAAAAHHRLSAFASAAVLKRAVEGIDKEERPLDEALSLAEVIEGVTERGPLEALKSSILSEYRRQSDAQALYGLLATALSRKLANNPELGPIATSYAAFFKEPRSLDVASLYRMGECVQAQFFYDDDDANESFASFEALYKRDKNWTFTNHGWYVEARRSANGRTIRVFANVPFAPGAPNTEDRRIGLVKLLNAQKLTPTVVIHRGHTWYVNQSLRYLTPETRLVYLGSCRGMENVYTVLAVSNRAQMIATRGVGTQTVNDPLLKSLNDELLTGIDSLDWDRFWHAMSSRLSASEFRDYVAPPRNASAILLAAYYDSISSPPAKQLPPQQTDSQPDRQIHQ